MRRLSRLAFMIWAGLAVACSSEEPEKNEPQAKDPVPPVKPIKKPKPPVDEPKPDEGPWFTDEARQRGITMVNQTGGPDKKKELIMSAVAPGCAVFDANGDGLQDIYIPNGNWLLGPQRDEFYTGADRPRNALYIQQKDGTFVDEAKARGVDHDGWGFGACAADIDNDGDQDLVVANLSFNCLFINDGKGHFVDIAKQAGIAGRHVDWSTGIAFGDYDKDGLLDIYIGNYADLFSWLKTHEGIIRNDDGSIKNAAVCEWQTLLVYCGPRGLPGQQDYLYRNAGGKNGEIKFEDVTKKTGIWRPKEPTGPLYSFQVLFVDCNKDGWPDIYVATDSEPSFYYESNEGKTFTEKAQRYNVALGDMGHDMAGMGATAADINGDGWIDLHKTNFSLQTNNIYICDYYTRNGKRRISFRDESTSSGVREEVYADLGWSVLVFDYDNDGDRDIFYANGHVYPEVDFKVAKGLNTSFNQFNKMFRNDTVGDRLRFTHVTPTLGPGFEIKQGSRGAQLIDFDNDGDQDIVVINLNQPPNLLVNKRGSKNGHWLQLKLVGNVARKSNLEAIGSGVWVRSGDRKQFFETRRGQGFLGCNDPRLHVGLGSDTSAEVEITWPNGEKSTHKIDAVDRLIEIRQEIKQK